MYTFYCTNLSMSIDVLAEMMDRPDLREFFAVSIASDKHNVMYYFRNNNATWDIHCLYQPICLNPSNVFSNILIY